MRRIGNCKLETRHNLPVSSFQFPVTASARHSSLVTRHCLSEVFMNPRRFLLLVFFLSSLMVFCAGYGSNAAQSSTPASAQMRKDAPFHPGGDYKPQATESKKPPVSPLADHHAYPQVPL